MRYSCQMRTKPAKVAMLISQSARVKLAAVDSTRLTRVVKATPWMMLVRVRKAGAYWLLRRSANCWAGAGEVGSGAVMGVSSVDGGTICVMRQVEESIGDAC